MFTLVAIFGVINHRYIKLPDTLGITAVGLITCLIVSALAFHYPEMVTQARKIVTRIDFSDIVFHGFLSLLLFAGALHVDLSRMREQRRVVLMLATVGVLISIGAAGAGFYYVAQLLGHPISLLWCLAFGTLISPTDPIAVLSVLKKAGAPQIDAQQVGVDKSFSTEGSPNRA